MKNMNSLQNNISELMQLAKKFNCFYLSGEFRVIFRFFLSNWHVLWVCWFSYWVFSSSGLHQGICKPFIVAGHQVGLIRPDIMKYLQRFPEVIIFMEYL